MTRVAAPTLAVATVALAYIAFGAFVGGGYDPGRDVAEAFAIAQDGARPLLGPLVAGRVHLGPAWYYLLALPLMAWPTWLAAAMAAVVVGALQFPLAYAIGRRLRDRSLGLLFVAALAMPGFASFELVGFASTNAVRTAVVASLYCMLRAHATPRLAWWFGSGLAASCAVHAHPSSGWLVPVIAIAALRQPGTVGRQLRDPVAALLAVATGFCVLFVPALLAPASLVEGSRAVAAANITLANLARAPALLWSVAWSGPHAIMDAVFVRVHPFADNVATVSALLALAGAARGTAAAVGGDRAARLGLATLAAATLFVALVRPFTPLYMTYSIVPGYALLVASGWRRFADTRPLALFVAPALFAGVVSGVGIVHAMRLGGGRIDIPSLADVTHAPGPTPAATDIWLYAASVDPLGRALCAQPAPVHGALAYALDVFYAMPLRMHCPQQMRAFIDEGAANGRLALALQRYRDLRIEPALQIGGLGIDRVARVVAAPPHRDLPLDTRYPPHVYLSAPSSTISYTFDAPAAELVVVTNARVTWMPDWDVDVRCDSAPLAPATADLVTRVYRCATTQPLSHWTIATTAPDPRALEVVTFVPSMR